MTPERRQQVEEIFHTALDLPLTKRASYLSEVCRGDVTLRDEVVNLLAYHESGEHAFNELIPPEAPVTDLDTMADDVDPLIGRRIGAYRIEREIGRGGMGAVYEATRADKEFNKRVAIKLVKRGMDTDFILRRFRKERQILAALDHPNIAQLLDGGTTDDGLPYFVMEFIEGHPLYQYCDEHQLNITERLKLFLAICDAAHYAHLKQVVHRDIKPSNVFVTSEGAPKLLDFGIAKLLNPDLAGDITHDPTATAMRLMTPEYASPEQVQGAPIGPTADVYSLGVLLYELLTGHRPYFLGNRAPHEIARVICEEAPVPLSVIITRPYGLLPRGNERTTLDQVYSARNASIDVLRRDLSGELETIVMRALRKEPAWRYQTAKQLRDDIASYLAGQPLSVLPDVPFDTPPFRAASETALAVLPLKVIDLAGGDSASDYLGTGLADALITRLSAIQRFAVRPTSSVLRYVDADPLFAGRELGVAFVLEGRIRRAGDRIRLTVQLLDVSDGTAAWAGQFDENFTDVLTLEDAISSNVAEAIVPHLTGDELTRLAKRGTNDPEAHEAYLRGRSYWNKFNEDGFAKAIVCYHQAIAIDPDYAVAHAAVAEYYNWLGIYSVLPFHECATSAYEAAATAVSIDPMLSEAHCALGQAILCRDFAWDNAERELFRAIELNPNYAPARTWYAFQLAMDARFTEASREARAAVSLDPFSIISRFCRIWCCYHERKFEAALNLCHELLKSEADKVMSLYVTSFVFTAMGRHEEAIANAEQCIATTGKASRTLGRLGAAYAWAGKVEQAENILREMNETAARRYISPYHIALVQSALGRMEPALELLQRAVDSRDAWVLWMAVDPELDPLRSHPRFNTILQELVPRLVTVPDHQSAGPRSIERPAPFQRQHLNAPLAPVLVTAPYATPVADTSPGIDDEAHQLFTAGRYYATRRTAEGLRQAVERLERAVELKPVFAAAWAELADCYALLNWFIEPPPPEAWQRAKNAALNAVSADPLLAEAHASLGFVRLHYDRNWKDAEHELRKAIVLNASNLVSHRWYAYSLSAMGRHEEAVTEIERAREISPQSPVIATAVANVLFLAGRFDDAIAQCHKALALDPGGAAAHTILRWAYEKKGMVPEALAAFDQERVFAGDTPTTRAKRAHVLAATGHIEQAREILAEIIRERNEKWVTAYEIAIVYSLLNDRDNAFLWLDTADQEHAVGFTFARVDPHLDNLRSDPRFAELLSSTNRSTS
jgi:serine/threonine protein kinase/tetratricopeptide (TPR) repeat protein